MFLYPNTCTVHCLFNYYIHRFYLNDHWILEIVNVIVLKIVVLCLMLLLLLTFKLLFTILGVLFQLCETYPLPKGTTIMTVLYIRGPLWGLGGFDIELPLSSHNCYFMKH
jgi:hypothetical protein